MSLLRYTNYFYKSHIFYTMKIITILTLLLLCNNFNNAHASDTLRYTKIIQYKYNSISHSYTKTDTLQTEGVIAITKKTITVQDEYAIEPTRYRIIEVTQEPNTRNLLYRCKQQWNKFMIERTFDNKYFTISHEKHKLIYITGKEKPTRQFALHGGVFNQSGPDNEFATVNPDQPAIFGGVSSSATGDELLDEYLKAKIKEFNTNKTGSVYITFIVDYKGRIRHPDAKGCSNEYLTKKALNIVKKMPRWHPGFKEGKPVNTLHEVILRFNN